jgi:hypothetical protein
MRCPRCDTESQVLDSRLTAENFTRRRRVCGNGHRFTTWETSFAPSAQRWAKKNGTAAVAKWRAANPDKARRLRLREEARREARRTLEPVEAIYARWNVG